MNKTIILSLFVCFSVLIIVMSVFIVARNSNVQKNNEIVDNSIKTNEKLNNLGQDNITSESENKNIHDNFEYVLKEFNGKIAVFKKDDEVPHFIFDVYINNLPTDDQKELVNGIYAKDDIELNRLIEDYSS